MPHDISPDPAAARRFEGRRRGGKTMARRALGLAWIALAATACAAQPAGSGAATSAEQPACRGARAVWDLTCPNYTGFQPPATPAAGARDGRTQPAADDFHLDDAAGGSALGLHQPRKGRLLGQGMASWYGSNFHGVRTASGEAFDKHALTAAHKTLPLGTRVLVHNARTGREVVVRINDRGPHARGRVIDVSKAAAEALGMVARGHDQVTIHALLPGDKGNATAAAAPDGGH